MNDNTQKAEILDWMKKGKSIAPLEALRKFGCWRLGARVYDLRAEGNKIARVWETDGTKRWARYSLLKSGR